MTKTLLTLAALATGLAAGTPAMAQDWRGTDSGYGNTWRSDYRDDHRGDRRGDWQNRDFRGDWRGNGRFAAVCSGDRAHRLEDAIGREAREGDISPRTADDLHRAVDHTERDQRQACGRSDFAMIRNVAERFDRIDQRLHYAQASEHGRYGRRDTGYRY